MARLKEIDLRPVASSDWPFLIGLFQDVRRREWEMLPLDTAQKRQLFESQQAAQFTHYKTAFPKTRFLLILFKGTPVGRFFTSSCEDGERILDIALESGLRGMGIGTALLKDYIDSAHASGRAVCLGVEKNNPALKLYQRLGFQIASKTDPSFEMILAPGQ